MDKNLPQTLVLHYFGNPMGVRCSFTALIQAYKYAAILGKDRKHKCWQPLWSANLVAGSGWLTCTCTCIYTVAKEELAKLVSTFVACWNAN